MKILLIFSFFFLFEKASAQKEDSLVLKNAVLYYYTYGEGSPILILSGGPGIESHQEDDLALKLSEKNQAILFDQRGTGKSWTRPFDSTTINLKTAVEDIEMFRKHLKIEKLTISGHSWGAILASAYTEKYPQNVKSLILIGGGEIDGSMTPIVSECMNVRQQLSDSSVYLYWSDSANAAKDPVKAKHELRKLNISVLIYDRDKTDVVIKQVERGNINTKMSNLMWKSLLDENINLVNGLQKKYKGSALIVFGWQDPIGATTLTQYEKAFPQALIKGINKCGHFPSVEQPEEFYNIIFSFLTQN